MEGAGASCSVTGRGDETPLVERDCMAAVRAAPPLKAPERTVCFDVSPQLLTWGFQRVASSAERSPGHLNGNFLYRKKTKWQMLFCLFLCFHIV